MEECGEHYLCQLCGPQTRLPIPDANQSAKVIQSSDVYHLPWLIHHKILLVSLPGLCSKERLRLLFGCFPPGDFLPLSAAVGNNTVLDEFKKKHPTLSPINYDSLINPKFPPSETCHQVIFEGLNGAVIHNSCLKTEGAAGPSGIDAAGWRHMCTSFQCASTDLCSSLASVAQRIATSHVDPDSRFPLF